jgi:hypothetical protein
MAIQHRTLIEKLISSPQKVFLIDCVGAMLTVSLLIVVIIPFNKEFGVPKSALYCLSAIACLFSFYSFCCSRIKSGRPSLLLSVVAVANCIYCILTIILLVSFAKTVTLLGFIYFTVEVFVIINLVAFEIRIIKKWNQKKILPE